VSKKSLLGALLVTLACAAGAQADTFLTEQATVNQGIVPPGGGTNLPNVNQVNLSGGGGVVLENNISSNTPMVGNKVNLLAANIITDFTRNPGGSFVADFGGGNKQVVAVFAGQGTVTSLSGMNTQATLSIDSGKLALFAIDKNTFDRLNANTWGTAGTAIATFNLANPADITKGIPNPNDPEALFFAASQVNQGAINLTAGQQIQDRLLFKDLLDPLIVVQPPFTGQNEGLFGLFNQTALAFTGNPFAGQEGTLNAISTGLGQGPFQTTGTGNPTDFNPQQLGGTIPADFITQLGGSLVPGILQEGQIPEPASMLLWGAVAGGMGIYGGIRRYRARKVTA